ncbi:unnamed protein product [Camellia sinensis]
MPQKRGGKEEAEEKQSLAAAAADRRSRPPPRPAPVVCPAPPTSQHHHRLPAPVVCPASPPPPTDFYGDVLSGTHLQGPVHLGILQEWFDIQWWNTRAFALFFMLVFVMLPLVLIRRLESLRFSSAVSILLAVVFVGICSVMAIFALLEGKAKSPRLMPQLDDQASFFNLFTAVPVIVTAFTSHFNE